MCSIGEDDFGDEGGLHVMLEELPLTQNDSQGVCKKCGQAGLVIKLGFREPECGECFLAYVRHKFRAALGSSKILPKGAKVLLVFDGSSESMVLLDMMHYAQTQNTFKRLHCSTKLLYIDDELLQNDATLHRKNLESISNLLKRYDSFEKYILPISASALTKLTELDNLEAYAQQVGSARSKEFLDNFKAIKSLTSRQDFLKHSRNKLIAEACNKLKCDFVFEHDISTCLAAQLLSDISLGRGSSAALDVSLVDDRLSGVTLVRPIKDLNEMEVKYYLQVQKLQPIKTSNYGDQFGEAASLQNLTKAFVANLQKNFPSTVSTVFRAGDKIAPNRTLLNQQMSNLTLKNKNEEAGNLLTCAFCNSSLDYFGSSTLLATEFSRLVSASAGTKLAHCSDLESIAKHNLYDDKKEAYKKELCHGCRNILNECPNKELNL